MKVHNLNKHTNGDILTNRVTSVSCLFIIYLLVKNYETKGMKEREDNHIYVKFKREQNTSVEQILK